MARLGVPDFNSGYFVYNVGHNHSGVLCALKGKRRGIPRLFAPLTMYGLVVASAAAAATYFLFDLARRD